MAEGEQKQVVEVLNNNSFAMEVLIEPRVTRYLLRPGETLTFHADISGIPVSIHPHSDGFSLTLFLGNDADPIATIDDLLVEPDFHTNQFELLPQPIADSRDQRPKTTGRLRRWLRR